MPRGTTTNVVGREENPSGPIAIKIQFGQTLQNAPLTGRTAQRTPKTESQSNRNTTPINLSQRLTRMRRTETWVQLEKDKNRNEQSENDQGSAEFVNTDNSDGNMKKNVQENKNLEKRTEETPKVLIQPRTLLSPAEPIAKQLPTHPKPRNHTQKGLHIKAEFCPGMSGVYSTLKFVIFYISS